MDGCDAESRYTGSYLRQRCCLYAPRCDLSAGCDTEYHHSHSGLFTLILVTTHHSVADVRRSNTHHTSPKTLCRRVGASTRRNTVQYYCTIPRQHGRKSLRCSASTHNHGGSRHRVAIGRTTMLRSVVCRNVTYNIGSSYRL